MVREQEEVYWLAFQEVRDLIPIEIVLSMIKKHGSLAEFWMAGMDELEKYIINKNKLKRFYDFVDNVDLGIFDDILTTILNKNISLIKYTDQDYPEKLKYSTAKTFQPPFVLLKNGKHNINEKMVAIVGTRNASAYARNIARTLAQELAIRENTIISGLARGIDYEAHSGALSVKGGKTIAVLPWMEPIYPPEHQVFSNAIIENGCILSERFYQNALDTKKLSRYQFVERNRIISALADYVVAVESGISGGTIHQVEIAIEQKKPVFTFVPQKKARSEVIEGFNIMVTKGARPISDITDLIEDKKYTQSKLYI